MADENKELSVESTPEDRVRSRHELQNTDRDDLEVQNAEHPSRDRADKGAVGEIADARSDRRIRSAEKTDIRMDQTEEIAEEIPDDASDRRDPGNHPPCPLEEIFRDDPEVDVDEIESQFARNFHLCICWAIPFNKLAGKKSGHSQGSY